MNTQTPSTTRRSPRREARSMAFAPGASASTYDREENEFWTERELSLIENALREHGEVRRRDLGQMLGCKYWGPRRFARALKIGVEEGRFQRVRFGVYGPA